MKIESLNCGPKFSGNVILLRSGVSGSAAKVADDVYVHHSQILSPEEFAEGNAKVADVVKGIQQKVADLDVTVWVERMGQYARAFQKPSNSKPEAIVLSRNIGEVMDGLAGAKITEGKLEFPAFKDTNKTFIPFAKTKY